MCAEYEFLEFNKQLKFSPAPVLYDDKRPGLSLDDIVGERPRIMEFLIETLLTKSPEWSYEKEWRIIRDASACGSAWNAEKHGALLPSIKPHAVILGCEASDEFSAKVTEICKERRITLYRMEKDAAEYKLNKKPILSF
ncbi:MAG: DUF2971 domain-containing protein [Clostridiales bacterium]|nr:DUF2971 domain-containing protein [Clostridiales bacterium]